MDELITMADFTNEEKQRINILYGEDFKNVEPEDIELIARFERLKAQQNELVKAEIEAINTRAQAELKEVKKTEKAAREVLEAQSKAAREHWERVRYGKE